MISLALAAFALAAMADDPAAAYRRAIEDWRAARETRLRGDEGWLTVAGLFWLAPGDNPFGSDPAGAIALPAHSAPKRAGVFRLHDGKVNVSVEPGAGVTVGGKPVTTMALRSDAAGFADVLSLGAVRLFVIERNGRLAVRVRDLQAPARKAFKGLRWFPIREQYRVVGRFVPHPAPKRIAVPNILGYVEKMESPGAVTFTLAGRTLSLEPVYEAPGATELFFIFKDRTSGKQTYGAGRFFYTPLPHDGQVVLDFNKAYTPPCAFTKFATCPLPPKQNHLPVAIEAGELDSGSH